ncbi:hypothetical protein C1H76_2237 [Elsinoe australis]|uniref:BTB domain-containing protein n=1 Tax=Elsinoe australis TaxID=40998 RepID=A0A4U7BCG1_9PEZI|nr:hypothetical protein C1H76_2237 [Elsinoe australis]
MDDLTFLQQSGAAGEARSGTLIIQHADCPKEVISNIDVSIVEEACPLLAEAFEPSRHSNICYIDDARPIAALAFLRWTYTLNYLPPHLDAVDCPLLAHLEVYRLAHNFAVEPLRDQAYVAIAQTFDAACYTKKRPKELIDAVRFAYAHYKEDVKLLSSTLSYCAANLVQHDLLFDKTFIDLLNELPVFHQDLCVANMAHAHKNEGAQTFIQVGAHCNSMVPGPFQEVQLLDPSHPLHPEKTTTVLSQISPSRRKLLQSFLNVPPTKPVDSVASGPRFSPDTPPEPNSSDLKARKEHVSKLLYPSINFSGLSDRPPSAARRPPRPYLSDAERRANIDKWHNWSPFPSLPAPAFDSNGRTLGGESSTSASGDSRPLGPGPLNSSLQEKLQQFHKQRQQSPTEAADAVKPSAWTSLPWEEETTTKTQSRPQNGIVSSPNSVSPQSKFSYTETFRPGYGHVSPLAAPNAYGKPEPPAASTPAWYSREVTKAGNRVAPPEPKIAELPSRPKPWSLYEPGPPEHPCTPGPSTDGRPPKSWTRNGACLGGFVETCTGRGLNGETHNHVSKWTDAESLLDALEGLPSACKGKEIDQSTEFSSTDDEVACADEKHRDVFAKPIDRQSTMEPGESPRLAPSKLGLEGILKKSQPRASRIRPPQEIAKQAIDPVKPVDTQSMKKSETLDTAKALPSTPKKSKAIPIPSPRSAAQKASPCIEKPEIVQPPTPDSGAGKTLFQKLTVTDAAINEEWDIVDLRPAMSLKKRAIGSGNRPESTRRASGDVRNAAKDGFASDSPVDDEEDGDFILL